MKAAGFHRLRTSALLVALCVARVLLADAFAQQAERTTATVTRRAAVTNSTARVNAFITFGTNVTSQNMTNVNQAGDGATAPAEIAGMLCQELQFYPGRPELYMYFQLDPALKIVPTNEVLVTVEYFEASTGHFVIDYDSFDEQAKNGGTYTRTRTRVDLKGDQRWHKAIFVLEKPRFEQRQNDGGDFRVAVIGNKLFIHAVKLVQE